MPILLLFDIDGTLIRFRDGKSKELFSLALKELFGKDLKGEMLPDFQGQTDLKILKEICYKFSFSYEKILADIESVWDLMYGLFREYADIEYIRIMPGISDLLKRLESSSDFQCGLLTGNFEKNAYLKLSPWQLEKFFPFGAFGSDHENRNELLPIALERANTHRGEHLFTNENTIIIGDSHRDIECGKVNNVPVLAVTTGWQKRDRLDPLNPEALFDGLENTEEVIETFYKLVKNR